MTTQLEMLGQRQSREDSATFDEYSIKLDRWARFSKDERMRYRLAQILTSAYRIAIVDDRVMGHPDESLIDGDEGAAFTRGPVNLARVVFLMLNPSTATAFKPDPTVDHKCAKFARLWGAQVLEVVNLFAFRSPYPTDLDAPGADLGTDSFADAQILAACAGAKRVIAAWGNGGWRGGRADHVRALLKQNDIELHHLGLTNGGFPTHPLARGKWFIPLTREPVLWEQG